MTSHSPGARTAALVWEQLAPYHIDRIECVARRLAPRWQVLGVEIAARSRTYAWLPSGDPDAGRKLRLFDGRLAEDIAFPRKFAALLRTLWKVDLVILGVPSSSPWVALLALLLRAGGSRVYFGTDSKADDYRRPAWREAIKRQILRAYDGAIVAGNRSLAYYRSLGVTGDRIWPGYDTLSTERVAALAAASPEPAFADRPFLFLGRFVTKKNLVFLLRAYARYRQDAGAGARRLVMAGDGPLEGALRAEAAALGISDHVEWCGFLGPAEGAARLRGAVALLLLSSEEQWGLVVNEAVAAATPVIASAQVGATDLLLRDGVNGFVVPDGDLAAAAEAMRRVGEGEAQWRQMSAASQTFVWAADSERFADTVQALVDPQANAAHAAASGLLAQMH